MILIKKILIFVLFLPINTFSCSCFKALLPVKKKTVPVLIEMTTIGPDRRSLSVSSISNDEDFAKIVSKNADHLKTMIFTKSGTSTCPTGRQALEIIQGLRAKHQISREELMVNSDKDTLLMVYTTI